MYSVHITNDNMLCLADFDDAIRKTIGGKIEISFQPNDPNTKIFTLKDAKVGIERRGAYIHFLLTDENGQDTVFNLIGIKRYDYALGNKAKYTVYTSDDDLKGTLLEDGSIRLQDGRDPYRFYLHVDLR